MTTKHRERNDKVAGAAFRLLADTYTLYLKTQNFHWNVTGPMFTSLHKLFETQYTELALAVDEIAERIRTLGHAAPGSYTEFANLTAVKEAKGVPSAKGMIRELTEDLDTVIATARELLSAAEAAGDHVSANLAVKRIEVSEKNAWMLRTHLQWE